MSCSCLSLSLYSPVKLSSASLAVAGVYIYVIYICVHLLREHQPRENLEMEISPRGPAHLPHAPHLCVPLASISRQSRVNLALYCAISRRPAHLSPCNAQRAVWCATARIAWCAASYAPLRTGKQVTRLLIVGHIVLLLLVLVLQLLLLLLLRTTCS